MIGLQRVCGLWRIYLDNQEDRELLLSSTLVLRNKSVNFYVCVPELHKYGIANRLHTHLLYGHFQDIWNI
jgi:hypothetical protein